MSILDYLKQNIENLNSSISRLREAVCAADCDKRIVVRGKKLFVSVGYNTYRQLSMDQLPFAKQLALERYNRNLLESCVDQLAVIEKCVASLEKLTLPDDVFTDDGFAVKWQNEKFHGKKVPDDSPYFTAKGEHVRSKSEVIIADRLNANGVPYHYEVETSLKGFGVQYPDFRVLNKRTRCVYFWEHSGMMEKPEYVRETIQKLENFENEDCLLGRDLIVTFESLGKPLSTKHIDKIIEHYLK